MTRVTKLLSAALALTLLGAGAVSAQPGRTFDRNDRVQENRFDGRFDRDRDGRRDWDRDRDGRRDWDRDRWDRDRDWRRDRGSFSFGFNYGPGYVRPGFDRFYQPYYRPYYQPYGWRVGQRFSPYGHNHYIVNDWYRYRLHRPPYGYHWVRVNNDFLLVAITSGLIAELLLNHSYY